MKTHALLCIVSIAAGLTAVKPTPEGDIQLVNGENTCSGRVEIYFRAQWGTVCDDDWDMNDARVVCRQLGCGEALSSNTPFGQGSGEIWLDNVGCTGDESELARCTHPGVASHNCGHDEDVGVVCIGVKKQVLRVKLTINSSLDVNYPAVPDTILEQLKQNMKDHQGAPADIKVRWVEQADGRIFHKEDKKKKKRERKPVLTKREL